MLLGAAQQPQTPALKVFVPSVHRLVERHLEGAGSFLTTHGIMLQAPERHEQGFTLRALFADEPLLAPGGLGARSLAAVVSAILHLRLVGNALLLLRF